jgi:hypothetical protein
MVRPELSRQYPNRRSLPFLIETPNLEHKMAEITDATMQDAATLMLIR